MASQVEAIKWVPGTTFIVDGFRFPSPAATAYFLTHAHSDHTTGLTSSWDAGPIYCSPITARILRHDFRIRPDRLRVLDLDSPAAIGGVEVTLIDANHCPGAVMLLFKIPAPRTGAAAADSCPAAPPVQCPAATAGPAALAPPFTTVLHTGDFRWHSGMASHPSLAAVRIDCLMLDTTYCQPRWRFPPQHDAIALMVAQMRREAAADPATLFVVGSYHIGKERAYLGAAHQLGWRVHCAPAKRRLLRLLGLPPEWLALLTDAAEEAQVHVLGMGEQLHEQALADRIAGTRWSRVVAIKPTGWSFRPRGRLERRDSGSVVILGIPYSEHSSWDDLRACVAALRPRRLVPTVNAADATKRRAIVDRFADLMDLSGDRSRIPGYFSRGPAAQPPTPQQQAPTGVPRCAMEQQQQRQQDEASLPTALLCAGLDAGSTGGSGACSGEDGEFRCEADGTAPMPRAAAALSDNACDAAACGHAAAGSSPVGEAREADRPPPAPRSGCALAHSGLHSPGAPAAAVSCSAAEAAAAHARAATPAAAPPGAAPGSPLGTGDDVDLAAVDVAEQHRILRFIQSKAGKPGGSGVGAAGGGGGGEGQAPSRKRQGGGVGGLCQPSLKRFFSPSQGS